MLIVPLVMGVLLLTQGAANTTFDIPDLIFLRQALIGAPVGNMLKSKDGQRS